MIKKTILSIIFSLILLPAFADIMPYRVTDIPSGSIGLYQANTSLTTYSKPENKSKINYNKSWSYLSVSASDFAEKLFAILIEKKSLSFIYAKDIDEDFVQVILDKKTGASGWAYKEDNFQFLPWITFFNMYGKKYNLRILKDAPADVLELHARSEQNSQLVAKLNKPKVIRLTTIQGNWALVTVLDIDNQAKTGYIRWRSDIGAIYLFPAIK